MTSINFNSSDNYKLSFSIANLNFDYGLSKAKYEPIFGSKVKEAKDGNTYGFVWSVKDWDNFNYILFSQSFYSDGYKTKLMTSTTIGSIVGGNKIAHQEWEENEKLNTQTAFNRISIEKRDNSLFFYFDDNGYKSLFATVPAEKWFSNKSGILLSPGSKIMLDYLTIEQEKPKQNSSPVQKEGNPPSSGSGIIITENGYITTNYHVVNNAEHIEIDVFNNGIKKTYLADIISSDKINNLALLKIRDVSFKSGKIPFGVRPFGVKVGEDAFALGYPKISQQGEEVKVTNGIISSKTGFQNDPTTYQISVPIQPGNSGGPLFDENGNLIAITNAGIPDGENVGYAIKISYLLNFIESQPSVPSLSNQSSLYGKSLPTMIEKLSPFTVIVRVNDITIESTKTKLNTIIEGGFTVSNYKELERNDKNGEYETVNDMKFVSKFYFTEDYIFFKKGNNKWLANKWTYDGFDVEGQIHQFYDNFGQIIVINKELNELAFWSERDGDFFRKVYLYQFLTKDDSVQPEE